MDGSLRTEGPETIVTHAVPREGSLASSCNHAIRVGAVGVQHVAGKAQKHACVGSSCKGHSDVIVIL